MWKILRKLSITIWKCFHTHARAWRYNDILAAGRPQRSIHKSTADTRFLGILICIFIFRCHAWSMIIDQSRFHWILTTHSGSLCSLVSIVSFIWHCFRRFDKDIHSASTLPMFDSDICVFNLSLCGDVHIHIQCTVHTLPIGVRQTCDAMKMKSGKFDWKRN